MAADSSTSYTCIRIWFLSFNVSCSLYQLYLYPPLLLLRFSLSGLYSGYFHSSCFSAGHWCPISHAIVVPPVITFNHSPPAQPQVSEASYRVLSVPLSATNSPEAASPISSTPTPSAHTHSTLMDTAPILQWPLYSSEGPPSSMPVLDASSVPFPDLLCVPANTPTTSPVFYSPLVIRASHPSLHSSSGTYSCPPQLDHKDPFSHIPSTCLLPHRSASSTQSVAVDASSSPPTRVRSPVCAPSRSVYGGPLWSNYRPQSPPLPAANVQTVTDSSSSEADDTR